MYFSFITGDTNESVPVLNSGTGFISYLVTRKGVAYRQIVYMGNGVFGGKNIYKLIAELNSITVKEVKELLNFYNDNFEHMAEAYELPKILRNPKAEWENCKYPRYCPNRGFNYKKSDNTNQTCQT